MAIPESQLDTWSHQGSIKQSSETYAAVRNALDSDDTPYADKTTKIFLQGSYCNDTNIYAESDVDVVIRLDTTFQSDLASLPQDQKDAFDKAYSNASYKYPEFKKDVVSHLEKKFKNCITVGPKAIKIAAEGGRRSADVIVAIQYRRYYKFNGIFDQSYDEGICFYLPDGTQVANYPIQHSDNNTTKHKATSQWFKPMARIFKNMRSRLVDKGKIDAKIAPSYFIEGLLYNVPNDRFGGSYQKTYLQCMDWLASADRSELLCANEQYYLLRDVAHVCWSPKNCDTFLVAIAKQWDDWV